MKKNIIYIAALALMGTACNNEDALVTVPANNNVTGDVKMITETISATNGDASGTTRVAIGNGNNEFSWSAGDQIAVHVSDGGSNNSYCTATLASGENTNSASFSVTYPDGSSRDAFAIFPASIVAAAAEKYGQSGETLDLTLPGSYTLAEVSDTKTPCPMIATNDPSSSKWDFYQLCGLLRLTVNGIPDDATYLQVDFGGYQVCGDFSIASPVEIITSPLSVPTISTSAIIGTSPANAGDKIRITDLGGSTSVTVNIPLPVGTYGDITVSAWNSSNAKVQDLTLGYKANRAKGKKVTTSLPDSKSILTGSAITSTSDKAELESVINFNFMNGSTPVSDIRFVRVFSGANKLMATYNGSTDTPNPVTLSKSNEETDNLPSSIYMGLRFDATANDLIVFQVIDADGKVYSGSINAPIKGGFKNGYLYKHTVDVKAYKFTVASGKQVCFSPGDLGVDNGVYSFTEPFTAWNQDQTSMTEKTNNPSTSKRTWFIRSEVQNGHTVYGINWRIQDYAPEWKYLVGLNAGRKIDNGNVSLYYKVHINTTELGDRYWCYLLPPDEATADDIKDDLKKYKSGTEYYEVTDYLKYIAKGFVLLMDTEHSYRLSSSSTAKWTYKSRSDKHSGYYQAGYTSGSKTYFSFEETGPKQNSGNNGYEYRIHTRYIHDVINP